ncbi:MAG: proton-conducting transporter membrane subunit [Pseudomonadota bacterium]|nr:proton-conducting transporter membrane subunit [Pseudomonadota bacterium]
MNPMELTSPDLLLAVAALTAVVVLIAGNTRAGGWLATLGYALQFGVLSRMAGLGYGEPAIESALHFDVFGWSLFWRYTALSWFFAIITVGAAMLTALFAAGDWGRQYRRNGGSLRLLHTALALNVVAMLLLLGSGELVGMCIGWELVSWASFLLMATGGAGAVQAALKYLVYAIGGGMAMLAGMALVYSLVGSFEPDALAAAVPNLSDGQVWALVLLFGSAFGVKMALLPFHLWQARAYALTPAPGATFLGTISSRMGLFAIIMMIIAPIGLLRLETISGPLGLLSGNEILAWIAVFTIILPTFTALRQNDALMLLTWHGIGQGGYMLLGLVAGDKLGLGSAGGIMHVFNYATYQAAIFMSVFAVVYRTGTADLNKLGGLITRMPISFVAMLAGIIGLAGLPPMSGFVSKWFIYRSLLIEGEPLLFVGAVIGTLGTILSVYKLIHNMFLGQLRLEHVKVREAPPTMSIPMLVLVAVVFATGWFPGIVLDWVAAVQASIGLPVIAHHWGGIDLPAGGLDMRWVVSILLGGFAAGAIIFYGLGNRHRAVHQLDNYAGGHFLSGDVRYQYSANFYAGLMRLIGPWYRGTFQWLESGIVSGVSAASMAAQGVLRPALPGAYLLLTATLLLWVIL